MTSSTDAPSGTEDNLRKISFTVDEAGVWTEHVLGTSTVTTVGDELTRLYEDEGMTPRAIFFEGLHYLSRVQGEYLFVERSRFLTWEGPCLDEIPQLCRLRAAGATDEDIYAAGVEQLSRPMASQVPAAFSARLAKLRNYHTDLAIYCAGIHYLSALPAEVEWELQEAEDPERV